MLPDKSMFTLPVLGFHHINDELNYTSIPRNFFIRLLEHLSRRFRFVDLKTVLMQLQKPGPVPDNWILMTFDDAYCDILEPLMYGRQNFGLSGILFPIVRYIGKDNMWNVKVNYLSRHMSINELKDLSSVGFDIGSHTMNHHNLLKFRENTDLEAEIVESKYALELMLETEIQAISYPFGFFNSDITDLSSRNYRLGFSTQTKTDVHDWRIDPFKIRRIMVHRVSTLEEIDQLITEYRASARA